MNSLTDLPIDLLQRIIEETNRLDNHKNPSYSSLFSLSQTCRFFNRLINQVLYQHITIYDNDNKSIIQTTNQTYIHIDHLSKFIEGLSMSNFQYIKSIHIHCKSNFSSFNYDSLYTKLNQYWSYLNHPIEFINFDVENIRQKQSLDQFLSNNNCTNIMEENDEVGGVCDIHSSVSKLCNLSNLSILKVQELNQIPCHNPNLKNLNLFIEGNFMDEYIKDRVLNLEQLEILQLNTTLSTKVFVNSNINCPNLEKLSICYCHSLRGSPLTFSQFAAIDFGKLIELELKLNCFHRDCDCINQFYNDLTKAQHANEFNNLQKLSIINYKSKNSSNNLCQYNYVINCQLESIFRKFPKLDYLYFNLNEFTKNDQFKINWAKFAESLQILKNLKTLIIYDFFNYWLPSMKSNQATSEILLNNCKCVECNQRRSAFNSMAEYDAANNYVHNFKNYTEPELSAESGNEYQPILLNKKCNAKLLWFIFSQLQLQQFKQLPIYSMNLSYFREDKELFSQFQELFKHNCLNNLCNDIKIGNNNTKTINLGGIVN